MKLDRFNKLLSETREIYSRIPIKEKTFMDVSGYPHYENVSSNILAFYFNTKEEHRFYNLLINSLIKVLKNKNVNINLISNDNVVEVSREYTTLKGNRIDIVLQSKSFVIGIENKLDASVYNDLEDYADTLNTINEKSIKILLSLHDNSKIIDESDFINITYQELLNQLKLDLMEFKDNSNKWYVFLNEFISNLEKFEGEEEMEEEILDWLKNNKKEIEELNKIKEVANNSIERKVEEIKRKLEDELKINFIKVWKGDLEMGCYIDSPNKYHVDATLNPEEWKVGVFTWSAMNHNKYKQILLNSNYKIIEDDGRHRWLFKFDYNTSAEDIISKVIEIYNYVESIIDKD